MKSDDFDALLDGNEYAAFWASVLSDPLYFKLYRKGFLADQDISLANYTAMLDWMLYNSMVLQARYDELLAEHPDYVAP